MAYRFTAIEPIRYHEFDYKRFLNFAILNLQLRELPFIKEWRDKWNLILKYYDDDVKKYIEEHPGTNPIQERLKANPKQFKKRNEMFVHEFNSIDGGTYYFHYDVEKMKRLVKANKVKKVTLDCSQFFLDKETIYEKSRVSNNELPYFAPVFAVPQQYIVVDGNKRIMAKLKNGQRTFTGYAFTPQQVIESFFFELDGWFYRLLAEISDFSKMLFFKIPHSEIKKHSIIKFENN